MAAHALNWPEGSQATAYPEAEDALLCVGIDDCLSTCCQRQGADEGIMGMPDASDSGLSMHPGGSMLSFVLAAGRTVVMPVLCSMRSLGSWQDWANDSLSKSRPGKLVRPVLRATPR